MNIWKAIHLIMEKGPPVWERESARVELMGLFTAMVSPGNTMRVVDVYTKDYSIARWDLAGYLRHFELGLRGKPV